MTTLAVRDLDDATDRALRLAAAELGICEGEFGRRRSGCHRVRAICARSMVPP